MPGEAIRNFSIKAGQEPAGLSDMGGSRECTRKRAHLTLHERLLAESIFLQLNTDGEIAPLYDNELTNVLFVTTLSQNDLVFSGF